MPSKPPPSAILFYGNQAYSVDEAAKAHTDAVLGDGPRDFSYQRFDASEMVKSGGGEAGESALGAFQIACESAPFLCESWVVRLDRLEAVRSGDRAARNLSRALEEMRLFRTRFEGETVWALEADLLSTDPREGGAEPQRVAASIESAGGGPPVAVLTAYADSDRFLLSHGGGRRVVDARDFLKKALKGRFVFSDQAGDAPDEGAAGTAPRLHALLERLLASPPPGLHLVLTADAAREGDLPRTLVTLLRKGGRIEKFVTYDDYHPVDWVLAEARTRNTPLTRPLAEMLIHLAGNDLGRLAVELDKLSLLFQGDTSPDEAAFIRAVSGGQGGSLFLLSERLGAKDLSGALGVLEHFLEETPGAHPLLLGILSRHLRQLLHLHDLMRLGVPEADWPSHLKLHPFLTGRVAGQARRFKTLELESMLRALGVLDVQLKLHSHLTGPLLREFVHAVCRGEFLLPRPRPAEGIGLRPG